MSPNHTTTLLLDADIVRTALERMRQAEPPSHTPLHNLVWVRKQVEAQGAQVSASAAEFALNHALADAIHRNVSHLREIEGLSTPTDNTRDSAFKSLRRDFSCGNAELEAWCILYYRFVRVDLNLQMQDIARALGANSRYVNRRLVHGCHRLTQELSRLEAEARAGSHRLWLKLKLPPATYATLFGMELRLPRLLELIETGLPRTTAVIGQGGIGKTTLVHAAARSLIEADRLGDVAWVELSSLTSHDSLLALLARTLGYLHLMEVSQVELEASLSNRMETTQTLIVIDNADLLEDPDHSLPRIDTLVGDGRVLITLREQPPNIPLHVLPVHPLPPNILTGLLQETARLRRIAGANLLDSKRLKAIIDAVGGNPLAAKLVVSHLAFLPLERVLEDLPSLQTPSGSPLFEAIFLLAWEHLSEDEKQLFMALSLMPPEGVDWHKLYRIVELPPSTLDAALLTLTQSCLVEIAGAEHRYTMHTLTRRFAQERAAAPPWDEIYRNLLRRILADELAAADGPYALALINHQIEIGELAEVVCKSVPNIAPAIRRSGQWAEWRKVLQTLLDQLAMLNSNQILRASALTELGIAAGRLGDADDAIDAFKKAVELWGEKGEFTRQSETLLEAGHLFETLGHTNLADKAFQQALAVVTRAKDTDLRIRVLNALAGLELSKERVADALIYMESALEAFGDDEPDGQILSQLGVIYLRLGRIEEALAAHERALIALDQAGDLPRLARAHLRMGIACHAVGQSDQAFQHLDIALNLMKKLGDEFGRARLLTSLGTLYADGSQQYEALRTWQEALALQERLNDQIGMATTLFNIADLLCQLGRTDDANAYLQRSMVLAEGLNIAKLISHIKNHRLLAPINPPPPSHDANDE